MPDFLSQKEIEAIIEKVSRTSSGKSAIKKAIGDKSTNFIAKYASENNYDNFRDTKAEMLIKAEEMKSILLKHITSDTRVKGRHGLADFPASAIIVESPKPVGNTGDYMINISFSSEALQRDSLVPESYPEGVPDIIALFVHGYNAHGSVFGEWHGNNHVSLRHREPNDFMARAVEEFNRSQKNGQVTAVLTRKYK